MPRTFKYPLFILIFSILAIGLLQIDDKLDPISLNMYERATAQKESKAFVYLLGIHAAVDEDPNIVGQNQLEAIRIADKKYLDSGHINNDYNFEDYPNHKALPSFTLDQCKLKTQCDYIDKLLNHDFDKEKITIEQQTLLDRFNTFLTMDDYHSITSPHLFTPLPNFQYIMQGNDLQNLITIENARNNNYQTAILKAHETIKHLRDHLKSADNLISKLIFTAALSKNIDLLSILERQNSFIAAKKFRPLTKSERSLEKAMNYEYGLTFNLARMMNSDPQILSQETGIEAKGFNLPNCLIRILYKPNMTINSSILFYKQTATYSHLSSAEYAQKLSENKPIKHNSSYIRNYIGTILYQTSTPDFTQYISRVFALDAKIKLYNEMLKNKSKSINPSEINNPFYPNKKSAYFTQDKKYICFDIPRVEQQKDRCLRLKI